MPVKAKPDLPAILARFKALLKKYENRCAVELDTAVEYFLNSKKIGPKNKPIFFAGTSVNKNTVSFYLMPVYCCPKLLDGISPQLRKRLHGKSCFRFDKVEPALIKELAELTKRGFEWAQRNL